MRKSKSVPAIGPLLWLLIAFVVVLFLTLAPAVPASAQETPAQPSVLTKPEVNYPVQFDISPPLRDMATEVSSHKGFHQASPVRYPKLQQLMQAAQRDQQPVKDEALQPSIGPLVGTTIGLNLLGVGNGFPGYSVPDAPTDVNLAVGDTQVVQWVNVSYAVFDKTSGAVISGPIPGNAFWAGFGGPCQTSNSGDIIAQWDKIAHRWLMSQNVFSSPYMTCVAVSTTPDATGTYYRFAFTQSGFPDYPKWGVWPDAYYQSQNNFGLGGGGFVGAHVCAYERAKLVVGDSTAKQVCFQTGTFDDSLLPGDLDSAATLPSSGQAEVFVGSIDNGSHTVYQYLFHVDFTTTSKSTFTGVNGTMRIPGVNPFSLACGGNSACIPQQGVADRLDSLGDRLMYRLAYRNFSGDHQAWLVSHAVTAGSSMGERWYEFRAPENSTSLSVYQQGTFAPDSNYRWMGSIAMDSAQDIALGYSISSSSLYPSISYTGRVATDPLGTMEAEASIVSGSGSQTGTSNRWGDYTSMALDAADDCTFWYTNQYYQVTASFGWSTRLTSFKFPGCPSAGSGTVTLTPNSLNFGNQTLGQPSSPQPVTLTNNQSVSLTINSSITASGDYSQTNNCGSSLNPNSSCTINVVFTPSQTGTRTGTLTVNDNGPGNPHTASLTGVGVQSGICVPGTLSNGGFETGDLSCWIAGGVYTPFATTVQAHSGTYSAQLGASTGTEEPNGDSSISQTVNIPSNITKATLSFWYWPANTDTTQNAWQEAQVQNSSGTMLAQVMQVYSNSNTWTQMTFDLTPYKGQSIQLYFNVHGDGSSGNLTYMYLDDVSLTTSNDTTPPVVTVTSPQNNAQVSGTITVSGSATDPDDPVVASMQVFIDNVMVAQNTNSNTISS